MSTVEQRRELGKVIETPLIHKKKQGIQCKNICITVNNYTVEQKSMILDFFSKHCLKYVLGEELGELKTPHLQGAFVLNKKKKDFQKFLIY